MQSKHSKTLPNLCSTEPIHLHVLSLSLRVRTVILQGILTSHSNRVHMQPKWVSESRTVSQQRARQKRSGQVRPWESYNMSGLLCIGLLVFFFPALCCVAGWQTYRWSAFWTITRNFGRCSWATWHAPAQSLMYSIHSLVLLTRCRLLV